MSYIDKLNLQTYFTNREVEYCPIHFVLSTTPLTSESYAWILEKTVGRFSLISANNDGLSLHYMIHKKIPAFEDSAEAMLYELTWS